MIELDVKVIISETNPAVMTITSLGDEYVDRVFMIKEEDKKGRIYRNIMTLYAGKKNGQKSARDS